MQRGVEYIQVTISDEFTVDLDDHADAAKDFVADRFEPEDVFDEAELEKWALSHGFVEEK